MKKLLTLIFVLIAVSHFGATQVFAQKKLKRKEVIIVKFLIPKQREFDNVKIPIEKNSKDAGISGGAVNECLTNKGCDNSDYWTYTFSANAFRTRKAITKVNFEIEVTKGCKTQKTFTVYRKRRTKLRLDCGVSLIAYQGFESEEAN